MTSAYNSKVRSKYSVEEKSQVSRSKQVMAAPQFEIDLWSINDLVERSQSEAEALERFKGMHGFSMSYKDAHHALDKALARKFHKS